MKFYVYTDGAARGNPGRSASGYRILNDRHKLLIRRTFYNGIKTNNAAEYIAIIAALKVVLEEYGSRSEVELFSDSELVVNQLNKNYKVKNGKLKELNKKASLLIEKFEKCSLKNVPRENRYVGAVDGELNELLDKIKRSKRSNILKKSLEQKKLFT